MRRSTPFLAALTLGLGLGAAGCSRERPAPAARAQTPSPSSTVPTAIRPPLIPGGQDFATEARLLFRVVACAGEERLPPALDTAALEEHCRWLAPVLARYRSAYLGRATPFFAAHRPTALPPRVVYPFGGGDLLSALVVYPDAIEYTTLSLEHAGDPRRIRGLDGPGLAQSLTELRRRLKGLFAYAESTSENLMQLERGDLPGQVSFFLVALAAHGYEPVSLRYFRLQPDGSLVYLTKDDLAHHEDERAQRLSTVWKSPDFSAAFSNAELVFRRPGQGSVLRVHRHIAANLSDDHVRGDPRILRHLESQGEVAAMTKAASYLLWAEGFRKIREYLLAHMVFMVSDSTGIPPEDAAKAGFVLETYGHFSGSYLAARKSVAEEYRRLWDEQPYRPLPFRFGYPDASGQNHLVLTLRPARAATAIPPSR